MENQVPIEILRVYMKDVSFETPNSPSTFQVEGEARITVDYQINSQKLQEMEDKNIFESSLTITAHALSDDKTVYLLEATQAAIIALPKLQNSENKMFLNGYCPDMLLPYLREFVSSMTTRGTVPMLMLKPESFSARVMMEMQQSQAQQGTEEQAKLDA